MKSDSYVYIIYRPDGRPCYVGKGRGERWRRHDKKRSHNDHLAAIYAKAGGSLPVFKFRTGMTDAEACALEISMIALMGREINGGPLVNQTDGGDGTAGYAPSPAWRAKRSALSKEMWADPEFRECRVAAMAGNQNSKKPHNLSPEWRSELAEKMRGNQRTKGMRHSDDTRAKMRARWADPEWKAAEMERRRSSGMYSHEAAKARASKRIAGRGDPT